MNVLYLKIKRRFRARIISIARLLTVFYAQIRYINKLTNNIKTVNKQVS